MITVAILINGETIMARSAVNISKADGEPQFYKVDDGSVIVHNTNDGAVALAIELLKTIKEVKEKEPLKFQMNNPDLKFAVSK